MKNNGHICILLKALGTDRIFLLVDLQIERIQNLNLWNCYQTKKKTMDAKNGHKDNEKQLFHGTDADSVPHVNQNGFNRSYAGKNGKEASNLAAPNGVSAARTQTGEGQCGLTALYSFMVGGHAAARVSRLGSLCFIPEGLTGPLGW